MMRKNQANSSSKCLLCGVIVTVTLSVFIQPTGESYPANDQENLTVRCNFETFLKGKLSRYDSNELIVVSS